MEQILANYQSDSGRRSNQGNQIKVSKSRKRKAYTTAFKIEAIEYAKKVSSVSKAAKKFSVSRGFLQDWKKQENQLRQLKDFSPAGKSKKHLPGAGRPLTYKDLDDAIAVWVRERRSNKLRVSRRIIQQQAERMFNAKSDEGNFKKFLNRHNFRLLVPTTVCQKLPAEYAKKLVDFVMFVSMMSQKQTYRFIYAADETAVWLDPSEGKSIDERKAKEVSVLSTGHDKMRVTVMLTARSDGKKCLPYVLLSRKRPDPRIVEKFKNKLVLCWAGKAPDVVWNMPFKAKIQQLYDTWMLNGAQMEWTASGNPRPASMDVYLEWIYTAWKSISKESIEKSFKECGITVCHDGSEDYLIHCFKEHGPVPEGRLVLLNSRAGVMEERAELEEIDPQQDEENGYISDESLDFEKNFAV